MRDGWMDGERGSYADPSLFRRLGGVGLDGASERVCGVGDAAAARAASQSLDADEAMCLRDFFPHACAGSRSRVYCIGNIQTLRSSLLARLDMLIFRSRLCYSWKVERHRNHAELFM